MNSCYRLFGTLLLLCLAGLALFMGGCGSSSKSTTSSQAMNITSGTWTITVVPTSGGGNSSMTASFTTFPCSKTDVYVGPTWYLQGTFSTTAAVCLNGGTPASTTSGFTPQGLVFGVGANPVAANGTTAFTTGAAFFASEDSSGNSDLYDLTGTFTASSNSVSGSYSCDPSCSFCSGDSGTFSGTMN